MEWLDDLTSFFSDAWDEYVPDVSWIDWSGSDSSMKTDPTPVTNKDSGLIDSKVVSGVITGGLGLLGGEMNRKAVEKQAEKNREAEKEQLLLQNELARLKNQYFGSGGSGGGGGSSSNNAANLLNAYQTYMSNNAYKNQLKSQALQNLGKAVQSGYLSRT